MTAVASDEIELKLELSAEAADALENAGLFAGKPIIIHQHARYFDTPAHDLLKAGFSLRIRTSGCQRVQTIKHEAGAEAGLFRRQEWERDVEDDLPVIDEATPIPALDGVPGAPLTLLFTVHTERKIWNCEGIEIALDRSRIVAAGRQASWCEVELEQKCCTSADLFALAHRIAALVPVRIGVQSKAQRGYRLLEPATAAARAGAILLPASATAEAAFKVVARACMVHFRLNEAQILDHGDPAALHQARVALRRLRSAFSIYKTLLADGKYPAFREELRWLAGALARARDLDVLIDQLDEGPLRQQLSAARAIACADAARALQSDRARLLMIDLAEWIAMGEWQRLPEGQGRRQSVRKFGARALDRQHRRVGKRGRDLASLDDAAQHEVRKATKKLRYATDFFAPLFDRKRARRRRKRFVALLEQLQDELGELNDLATFPRLLAELKLAVPLQAAALCGAASKPARLAAAVDSFNALMAAKRFWR